MSAGSALGSQAVTQHLCVVCTPVHTQVLLFHVLVGLSHHFLWLR